MSQAIGIPAENARLMRSATYASVTVALALIAVKVWAWQITDSVSMLASLVDSTLDLAASLVNLLAVRHALEPADDEHRFGHGKVEGIAGLAQAATIAGSGGYLLIAAADRLAHPRAVEHGTIGIAVSLIALAATLALVGYQQYVVRKTRSLVVSADSLHYVSDLLTNLAIIVALVLTVWFEASWADAVFALGIGLFVVWGAASIIRQSLDMLMDREMSDVARAKIERIVLGHPEVRGLHELRTRLAGSHTFIQFHIGLDGAINLHEAHRISDEVEARVRAAFPGAEVMIHQDPAGLDEGHRLPQAD